MTEPLAAIKKQTKKTNDQAMEKLKQSFWGLRERLESGLAEVRDECQKIKADNKKYGHKTNHTINDLKNSLSERICDLEVTLDHLM